MEDVLYAGHTGVVVKLVEAAISCPEVQPGLFEAVQQAFHLTSHSTATAPVLLALMTYEVFTAQDNDSAEGCGQLHPTSLHGSLLLQALLKFQDTKVVVRSVLKMKVKELLRMSCDPHGSHVLTTLMTSSSVSNKKKEKLVAKLEVGIVTVALP